MDKSIESLETVLWWAKLGEKLRDKISQFSFPEEKIEDTLDRITKTFRKFRCATCLGRGKVPIYCFDERLSYGPCKVCNGTGEKELALDSDYEY